MSLDVSLTMKDAPPRGHDGSGIFVRENGQTVEISREEWDRRNPGREPVVVPEWNYDETVFDANITHNLGRMAAEAGVYDCCWRPEENGITHARQLIEPLRAGIAAMRADPARFEQHNPKNGWGSYDGFLPWLERYLTACEQYPDATVRASR